MTTTSFFRAVWTLVAVGGAWLAWELAGALPRQPAGPALVAVRRGPLVLQRTVRGELRAQRSAPLYAPRLPGVIRITRLAAPGTFQKAGSVVVEFDADAPRARMEEKKLDLDRVDSLIDKEKADQAIAENQAQVDLLAARFAVRRAELDAKRNELLPPSDAAKNVARLDEARRSLERVEQDQKANREHALGRLAILQERRNKSMTELDQERKELAQTRLTAPFDGMVRLAPGAGSAYLRVGDEVNGGAEVADVLDLAQMEVVAPLRPGEAAPLKAGQLAEVRLDALSGTPLPAQVTTVGATPPPNESGLPFQMRLDLDLSPLLHSGGGAPDASGLERLVRPGMLGDVEVFVDTFPDTLIAPAAALSPKDGGWVARVKTGDRLVERKVAVLSTDGILTAIRDGLKQGELVAIGGADSGKETP